MTITIEGGGQKVVIEAKLEGDRYTCRSQLPSGSSIGESGPARRWWGELMHTIGLAVSKVAEAGGLKE